MSQERYDTAVQMANTQYRSALKGPLYRERYMDHTARLRAQKGAIQQIEKGQKRLRSISLWMSALICLVGILLCAIGSGSTLGMAGTAALLFSVPLLGPALLRQYLFINATSKWMALLLTLCNAGFVAFIATAIKALRILDTVPQESGIVALALVIGLAYLSAVPVAYRES